MMEEDFEHIDCPARSITHAFHQIETATTEVDIFAWPADTNTPSTTGTFGSSQTWTQRKDSDRNSWDTQNVASTKFAESHITRESKHVSVQGELATTTNFNGTLIFHKYETTREQMIEKMDQRTSNN